MIEQASLDPFVGPVPFSRNDEWRFFGRSDAAEEVFSLLLSSRALLLYGQSGSGKTSLVQAGLLPLVEQERFDILPTARVQGATPPGADVQVVNRFTYFMLNSWGGSAGDCNHPGSVSDALRARARPDDAFGDPARRLVVLDQFEELFTAFPERWPERAPFLGSLAAALDDDPRLHVMMCIREDYLADILSFASIFPDRLRTRFRLQRLGLNEARQAIEGPVVAAGCSFAPAVIDRLVTELALIRVQTMPGLTSEVPGEFVEPVQLQVVCSSLWRSLPLGTERITADHVQQFGDVTSALAAFYDDAISRTVASTGVDPTVLRDWFSTSLITPANTRSMAFRSTDATGGLPNAAIDVLEDLHMVRAEARAGGRWYELTHDRFIGPIQASNATYQTYARVSFWGGLPLGAGLVLTIVVALFGPHNGVDGMVLESLGGGLAALGAGQLLNGWLRRREQRRPSNAGASYALRAVAVLLLLVCLGALIDQAGKNPWTPFSRYVSSFLPGASVTGRPSCGGSNLRVFVNGPQTSMTDVQSPPSLDPQLLAQLAKKWCTNEASKNMVGAQVSAWVGLLALVLPVMAIRRRRELAQSGAEPAPEPLGTGSVSRPRST